MGGCGGIGVNCRGELCKEWGWSSVKIFKGDLLNDGGDVEKDNQADYEDEEGAGKW